MSIIYIFTRSQVEPSKAIPGYPKIPEGYRGDAQIIVNIDENDFDFPKQLPMYTTSELSVLTEEQAKKYANNLGFTFEPEVDPDITEGKVYVWIKEPEEFFVYPKSRKTDYYTQLPERTINKQLSDDAYIAIAKDFSVNAYVLEKGKLDFVNFVYYVGIPGTGTLTQTTKENAGIIRVNLKPKLLEYPILTLDPNTSPLYVEVLPDGEVYRSEYHAIQELGKTEEEFRIKSYQEVLDTLNQAVIMTLDLGYFGPSDVPAGDIVRIDINKIELAYLLDSPSSIMYQPVYLLTGKAEIRNVKNPVNTQLYLPALIRDQD
jgi:hypothetical protein